ncbi:MAG TPA: hypothetical protein VF077_13110 [Nitrospiraceae bacterium]
MTIKIGLWIIPLLLSLACLAMMLRTYTRHGDWDFGQVFRVLWIIQHCWFGASISHWL